MICEMAEEYQSYMTIDDELFALEMKKAYVDNDEEGTSVLS